MGRCGGSRAPIGEEESSDRLTLVVRWNHGTHSMPSIQLRSTAPFALCPWGLSGTTSPAAIPVAISLGHPRLHTVSLRLSTGPIGPHDFRSTFDGRT